MIKDIINILDKSKNNELIELVEIGEYYKFHKYFNDEKLFYSKDALVETLVINEIIKRFKTINNVSKN